MVHGSAGAATMSPAAASPSCSDHVEALPEADDLSGLSVERMEACLDAGDNEQPRQVSPQAQPPARKRKRTNGASDFQKALLSEQKLLRESLEAAHAKDVALRERHLKLQEAMVAAVTRFFNTP